MGPSKLLSIVCPSSYLNCFISFMNSPQLKMLFDVVVVVVAIAVKVNYHKIVVKQK